MHRPYKKITAQLLLFSFLLESCYNPNIGIGKQALPTPDPADKQRQYAGEPHDKYPPSHTLTTADKHPVRFTYHNGQWQAAIKEHTAHGSCQRRQVPVVFERGLTLEDVVYSNPAEQKQLLHLCPSQEEPGQIAYVYVGRGPSQSKPQPQLLSSPGARQTTPRNEVGLAQQQATAQQQPKELGSSAIQRNRQESRQAAPNIQQAQEQPDRQALPALPSPVQQIGEGPKSQEQLPTTPARVISKPLPAPSRETPSQGVAKKQPTSPQRVPSRRALSWRNQHELLHSQRAAQAKREQSATRAKPANELAQPAQPSQAIPSTTTHSPSLSDKAPQDIASQNLLAQGGHPVRFMHRDGQWQARVMERIGAFYRVWVLPVACQGHGDVAKALADLQEKPTQYTQRRIHVMHTKQLPYLPQFVYLGAQGLQGGGNGAAEASGNGEPQDEPAAGGREDAQDSELSQSLAAQGREASLVTLHERMAQEDITSTKALVDALNDAQTPEEQQALQQWIERYIEWFNDQTQHVGNLALFPEEIQEYTCLAHIKATPEKNGRLLRSYFDNLCNNIEEKYQHGEEPLLEALEYTLQSIDSDVFDGKPAPLIHLGNTLLAKLDPGSNVFNKANYPSYRSTLYALHQVLVLIQQIDPSQWDEGIYNQFRANVEAIEGSARYYPVRYHALLLDQILQRLKSKEYRARLKQMRIVHGLRAGLAIGQVVASAAAFRLDSEALQQIYESLQAAFAHEGIEAKSWYDRYQDIVQYIHALEDIGREIKDFLGDCNSLKDAFASENMEEKTWYDWHQVMKYASLLSLRDAREYSVFNQGLEALQKARLKNETKEGRNALRFGIVQQLGMLALRGGTGEVRKQSIQWLEDLANPEAWGGDQEVMEGLLDGLVEIAVHGKGAEKKQARKALERLESLGNGPAVRRRDKYHPNPTHREAAVRKEAAQEAITAWLGGQKLADKLSALPARAASPASGGLFSRINSTLRAPASPERPAPEAVSGQGTALQPPQPMALPALDLAAELRQAVRTAAQEAALPRADIAPLAAQAARQTLRAHYQQPDFAQVRSLFEGEALKHVDALQCQLMLIEQVKVKAEDKKQEGTQKERDAQKQKDDWSTYHEWRERVKNPIALEDLFKKRKTKPDGPEQAIHKVLLVGEPGTGKTTLSKKIAYHWAQEKWGQEFNAVYVLPVRALQQSQYDNLSMRRDETLPTAIVNNCFPPREEEEYKRLRQQISEELKQPTTLVVLDGLDERYGASKRLLEQALGGRHKLLLLSRPYGIETERTMVDIEIEHAGFNDGQMEAYVRDDLSAEPAEELLAFIRAYPAIASIAHVPVNLQILCALWQGNQASVRQAAKQGSLPGLYRRLTTYLWKRYTEEKHKEDNLQKKEREALFDTLGEIALKALEQGEVPISPVLVEEVLDECPIIAKEMVKESGFLLLQAVGGQDREKRQYQFPHLTFQEYFAGRPLAKQLLSGDAADQDEVQDFFSAHKYAPQYGRTLSFLSGEVSKAEGAEGVEGISKLLRMLHEGPQEVVGVQHLLLQLRLLNEWVCVAGEDVASGLGKLKGEFPVMRSLAKWLGRGLKRVREKNDSKLLELLTSGLQSARAVAEHASEQVLPPLLEALRDKNDPYGSVRRAARSALGQVVAAAPDQALEVLPPLLEALRDKNDPSGSARRAASSALGQVVAAAPELAEQVLPPLLEALRDKNDPYGYVRSAASEALGQVVAAAPELAEQVLPPLLEALRDKNDPYGYVRSAAIRDLGKVVEAAPAEKVLQPLLEALRDQNDPYGSVRSAAIRDLGKVVEAAPGQAEKVLPPLLEALRDQNDPYGSVRSAAIRDLGKVVEAAPGQAEKVLQPLLEALRDKNDPSGYVRSAAIRDLGKVVEAAPGQAEKVLQPLLEALKNDPSGSVRRAASSALGEVVQAAPQKAAQVLPPLLEVMRDNNWKVRRAARSALGQVVAAAPDQALEVLPPLLEALKNDPDGSVRSAASSALGQVVAAAPELAEQVLPPLLEALRDKNDPSGSVRSAASSALGQVVAAAPELAEQVLPPLLEALRDKNDPDGSVRRAASSALGQVVAAAPELAEQVLPSLLEALRDKNDPYGSVRRAASSALGQFSLQQLIASYWATQDQAIKQGLIPLIAARLYHTPLLVQNTPHSEDQRLVLYPSAGQRVEWKKPQQEVQRFVQQIQRAAQLKWRFWPF